MRYICIFITLLTLTSAVFAMNEKKATFNDAFLSAHHVTYDDAGKYVEATGDVLMISDGYIVRADQITYDVEHDELFANGRVRISDGSKKVTIGESVFFKDKFKKGIIKQFVVYLGDNTIIAAKLAERTDAKHGQLINARYTPCSVCEGKNPLWQISAQSTELDLENERVTYKNATFEIYGKPVAFIPYFSHPTPGAKAQSGVLLPTVHNNRLGIPIYYRPKSNLDITLTPRLPVPKLGHIKGEVSSGIIYEMEMRHLTNYGQYKVQTSFINTKAQEDRRRGQYYLFANGEFADDGYNYKVGINRASNKSYLKNYYQMYQPYLLSNLSVDKANKGNFASAEALHFQGMREEDREVTDPAVLPSIHARQITNLGDEKTYITMENKTLGYGEDIGKRLGRTAMQLSLTHLHTTESGHLFKAEAYNRGDFYYIKKPALNATEEKAAERGFKKTIGRNTPELRLGWQYPLMKVNKGGSSLLVEPQSLLVLGTGDFTKNRKYANVDTGIYDLSEENIFIANRYSGVDYHEYGRRISYGLGSTLDMTEGYLLQGFIGKLNYLSKRSHHYGADIVGRVSLNCDNKLEPYYNFKRKARRFIAYQDDLGIRYNYKDLIYGNAGIISIKPVKYFEYTSQSWLVRPKIRQVYVNLGYNVNEYWSVGVETRADILSRRKTSPIYRNMRVTYQGDCVSITTRFGHDYTSDSTRGIHKTRTNSIGIGLKTLM